MSHIGRGSASFVACLLLVGCASTQLNYNTLDLGSSVSDLQKKQVLYNLSLFVDDPAAFPTHIDLQSGSAQTTNTIQPTVGVPLAASHLLQFSQSTGNGGTTNEVQTTRPGFSLSIEGQNAQQQAWSYQPIIDGKELLRLRALYRYVVGVPLPCDNEQITTCPAYDNDAFEYDFPIFRKAVTTSYSNLATEKKTDSGNIYCPDIGLNSLVQLGDQTAKVTCASISTVVQTPDENTLHYPNCILCLKNGDRFGAFKGSVRYGSFEKQIGINRTLKWLRGGEPRTRWLLTERDPLPSEYDSLGHYGHHELYIATKDRWKLSEFTLFVLMATAQSAAESSASGGGGSGGGGGGSGKKNSPGGSSPSFLPQQQQLN
jgi:hypothetical protein